DVMCGMYATAAILSAIEHRHKTGKGQYIDLGLLDTQIAWLINQGSAYLVSGDTPQRLGNGHPTIVPYDTVPASDGEFIIAVGNDSQFQRLCETLGAPEWSSDPRFEKNTDRVANRHVLMALIAEQTSKKSKTHWIEALEKVTVPCGPVNTIPEAFADPQAFERQMIIEMESPVGGSDPLKLIGNPIKMSETPVSYRRPPPRVGQHSKDILISVLEMDEAAVDSLVNSGVVGVEE
ncbi:MAG: CaiB/BaiF CoA-transferase family protein, partial [Pseudomonadota bacterium]